jgi:hypothetical protein
MKRRDRLNRLEDLGFYIAMIFSSVIIGFLILGVIEKIVRLFR